MNLLRNLSILVITLAVVGLCADLAFQAHRIADDIHNAAAQVDGVTAKLNATATKLDADAAVVVGRINAAVDQADATVDRAVNNAIGPLPTAPSLPLSLSSVFKPPPAAIRPPAPAPAKKP